MRNKIIFIAVGDRPAARRWSAPIICSQQPAPLPPAFNPAANPYAKGIYANGIIESDQAHGENINIYPEVAGTDHARPGRRRRSGPRGRRRC